MANGDVVSVSQSYQFPVTGNSTLYARFAQKYNDTTAQITVPSGYTGLTNLTTAANYPITNGYTANTSTTYALLTGSARTTGYVYFTFSVSEIPSGSTINSVSCIARLGTGQSTTAWSSTTCQLYSGTTPKGTSISFASTSNYQDFTLSTGSSWSPSDFADLRIRVGGTGSTASGNKRIRFYGATVSISYTFGNADFIVNTRSEVSGVTVYPETQNVKAIIGERILPKHTAIVSLSCSSLSGYSLLDNGTNVNSRATSMGNSATGVPNSWTDDTTYSSFTFNSTAPINNAFNSASNTTNYAQLILPTAKATCGAWWGVDLSDISSIPSWATINSISCSVRYAVSSSYYVTAIAIQLYSGTTAKGSATTTLSTTNSTSGGSSYNMTTGTWTLNELKNLRLHVQATRSSYTNDAYVYLYGATVTVSYTASGLRYEIDDVTSDHTVVLKSS